MKVVVRFVFLFVLAMAFSSKVLAEPRKKKILVDPASLSCSDVVFGKRQKTQQVCCNDLTAGIIRPSGGLVVFTSLKKKNRQARARAKAKGKPAPKKWRQLIKESNTLCRASEGPTPTPTPGPNEPTHWNSEGEVNSVGKECFGIPQHLRANVLAGEEVWITHCQGCHGSQTAQINHTFVVLRERTSQSPMFITEQDVPDEDLANITAYLNRFNPDICPQ